MLLPRFCNLAAEYALLINFPSMNSYSNHRAEQSNTKVSSPPKTAATNERRDAPPLLHVRSSQYDDRTNGSFRNQENCLFRAQSHVLIRLDDPVNSRNGQDRNAFRHSSLARCHCCLLVRANSPRKGLLSCWRGGVRHGCGGRVVEWCKQRKASLPSTTSPGSPHRAGKPQDIHPRTACYPIILLADLQVQHRPAFVPPRLLSSARRFPPTKFSLAPCLTPRTSPNAVAIPPRMLSLRYLVPLPLSRLLTNW